MQNNQLVSYKNLSFGVLLLLLTFSVTAFYCNVAFHRQGDAPAAVRIKIPDGTSLAGIAAILEQHQVVGDKQSFINAAQILGKEKSIPAGVFTLVAPWNNNHIIQQMVNGKPHVRSVTLIEGWTIDEIAAELAERLAIDSDQFIALCHDSAFISQFDLPVSSSLEGFLLPETYRFFEGQDSGEIIRRLVAEYKKLFEDEMDRAPAATGLNELEIITLASIIEGEAIFDEERPIIAAVYYNRLEKRMRLQADPTIQYIIDGPPRRLLTRDLAIDSPYNTYKNYGLPPGPINNPGKQSIMAALYPVNEDYLYFVARGDGYHTFSRTQREHNRAKRKFQHVRWKVARERRLKKQQEKSTAR